MRSPRSVGRPRISGDRVRGCSVCSDAARVRHLGCRLSVHPGRVREKAETVFPLAEVHIMPGLGLWPFIEDAGAVRGQLASPTGAILAVASRWLFLPRIAIFATSAPPMNPSASRTDTLRTGTNEHRFHPRIRWQAAQKSCRRRNSPRPPGEPRGKGGPARTPLPTQVEPCEVIVRSRRAENR